MAIDPKKYTRAELAKMVEDAQETVTALEAEITDLKNCIDEKNDLIAEYANLKAEMQRKNIVLVEQLDQMNGEAINRTNEIANLKADAEVLRNNLTESGKELSEHRAATVRRLDELKKQLTDTEAALGRANAEVSRLTVSRRQLEEERDFMSQQWNNAGFRADYAEAHPWGNLWAWVKRKLGVTE